MSELRILPAGDLSVVAEFGNEISTACNEKVRLLNQNLKKKKIKGIVEMVPTFRSLLIYYDPLVISYEKLCKYIRSASKTKGNIKNDSRRIIEIPVCYGGQYGEDLAFVAEYAGMSKEEVIRIHSGRDYRIYMLGFLPGFPYLGGMDSRLTTPRLPNPRTLIPAGSVGIGGEQTGIYPVASPGGWRLIGRTPLKLYDSEREKTTLYQAGDYIRFRPVDEEEYHRIKEQVESGTFRCKITLEN
ncbi:MAG: Sensor histidine kinase inhibitor, KipI family [Lachnoclostridium sp.]